MPNTKRRVPYVSPGGKREPGIYVRTNAAGVESFEIGWRDTQGKQRWKTVEGGVKAARAKLAEEHAKRARGERVAADPRLRFNDAADKWWESRVAERLRPTTQTTYAAALKHLRAQFGARRLTEIQPSDVAAYVTMQQRNGKKGWTVKGHLSVLSAVFTYSSRHLGFPGANPVTLLDRTERPSTSDMRRHRILSKAELFQLLDAVPERQRPIFELAAETGARIGEVLGLQWGCVDLDSQSVRFMQQIDRKGNVVPPKTERSDRWIELTPQMTATLRALKVSSPRTADHDFVFTTSRLTPYGHQNVGERTMNNAVKKAGLEAVERDGKVVVEAPNFHDLRHTLATRLIAQGWDVEEVSAHLGHSSTDITHKTYVHAFDARKRSDRRRDDLTAMFTRDDDEGDASVVAIGK